MANSALERARAGYAIATQLYGFSPADVFLLATVFLAQVGVVLVACWLPARRATRIDPIVALGRD